MVLIPVEELIDINPCHGLCFGNLDPLEGAVIERLLCLRSEYDVSVSDKHLEGDFR